MEPQNKHLTNVRSSKRTLLANIAKTTLFHSHQIDECFPLAPSTYGEKLFGFIRDPKEKMAQNCSDKNVDQSLFVKAGFLDS